MKNVPRVRPPKSRLWARCFFVVWAGVSLAGFWALFHRPVSSTGHGELIFNSNPGTNGPLLEQIENWLTLADINLHGIYPWVLLAPWVILLSSRFSLGREQLRRTLPAQILGCCLFAIVSHVVDAKAGFQGHIMLIFGADAISLPQRGRPAGEVRTGGNFTNTPWASFVGKQNGGMASPKWRSPAKEANVDGSGLAWWTTKGNQSSRPIYWNQQASDSIGDVLSVCAYMLLVGGFHAFHFYRSSREREVQAAELEHQLIKTRLHTLQAQLHPHFLFNALNAISTLMRHDTRAAHETLLSFSELLRMTLSHSSRTEVPLSEDLAFLKRYVEIQQVRLGDRFHFEQVIPTEALNLLVPTLLLQPLVENAIRHGIDPSPNSGTVRVTVEPDGAKLRVIVEDDGVGISGAASPTKGTGIGLVNLRTRLESLYGAACRLEYGASNGGGVAVRVEIPLRSRESEMLTVAK